MCTVSLFTGLSSNWGCEDSIGSLIIAIVDFWDEYWKGVFCDGVSWGGLETWGWLEIWAGVETCWGVETCGGVETWGEGDTLGGWFTR